jgi:hypothetical protein
MRKIETLTDQQRRDLVHIYAALRDGIADEVDYERDLDALPLTPDFEEIVWQEIYAQLTRLMVDAHAEEASKVEREIDAYVVHLRAHNMLS